MHDDEPYPVPPPTFTGTADVTGSATIGTLAAALARAQADMRGAVKDAKNLHFQSSYATLASVVDAARPLAAHGLALMQWPSVAGSCVRVTTLLSHASGEWLAGSIEAAVAQASPQAIGSALTYLRRYATLAVLGLAPDDDDGEAAEAGHRAHSPTSQATPDPRPTPAPSRPRAADPDPKIGFITQPQQRRLFAISKQRGWDEDGLRAFLGSKGFTSSKAIPFAEYDAIIADLEHGPVPTDSPF